MRTSLKGTGPEMDAGLKTTADIPVRSYPKGINPTADHRWAGSVVGPPLAAAPASEMATRALQLLSVASQDVNPFTKVHPCTQPLHAASLCTVFTQVSTQASLAPERQVWWSGRRAKSKLCTSVFMSQPACPWTRTWAV